MKKLAPPVERFVPNLFNSKAGGVALQGVVGVYRHKETRRLIFSVVIKVTYCSTDDPTLTGRELRWSEMSYAPEEFGRDVMDQVHLIESFIRNRSRTQEIKDFLGLLAGTLFDAHFRLRERAEKNRVRALNRATQWFTRQDELVQVEPDNTFALPVDGPAVVVGM